MLTWGLHRSASCRLTDVKGKRENPALSFGFKVNSTSFFKKLSTYLVFLIFNTPMLALPPFPPVDYLHTVLNTGKYLCHTKPCQHPDILQ